MTIKEFREKREDGYSIVDTCDICRYTDDIIEVEAGLWICGGCNFEREAERREV